MGSSFQQKSAKIFLSLLIGVIVVSFAITGIYDMGSPSGSSGTVASVNGVPIKEREFNMTLQNQIRFYSQFQGKEGGLTSEDIRNLRIHQNVINSLVEQKLNVELGKELGAIPANSEIKEKIKSLPSFQTNEQFNIELYKRLLEANNYTPSDFEQAIKQDIIIEKSSALLEKLPISKSYAEALDRYKSEQVKGEVIFLAKRDLQKNLPVTPEEVENFLKTKLDAAKNLFTSRKSSLDTNEEVFASHILIANSDGKTEKSPEETLKQIQDIAKEARPSNFKALAKKYSQDPSVQENGGTLGWFPRGRMVPEFDEAAFKLKAGEISAPVKTDYGHHLIYVENRRDAKEATFDEHKKALAEELIREEKIKTQLDAFTEEIKNSLKDLLARGDAQAINEQQKKFSFTYLKDAKINRLEGIKGPIPLAVEKLRPLFGLELPQGVLEITENEGHVLIRPLEKVNAPASQPVASSINSFSRSLKQELIKQLQEEAKIKVSAQLEQ